MPGASAASAWARERSAMPTETRMASISSGVLTRRARSNSGSPSTSSADGKALGKRCADDPVIESVATVRAVEAPSIVCSTFTKLIALNEIP